MGGRPVQEHCELVDDCLEGLHEGGDHDVLTGPEEALCEGGHRRRPCAKEAFWRSFTSEVLHEGGLHEGGPCPKSSERLCTKHAVTESPARGQGF